MKTRRRRALSAEEASMTPEQRAEIRQLGFRARALSQSSRYQRDRAIEKSFQLARPKDSKK